MAGSSSTGTCSRSSRKRLPTTTACSEERPNGAKEPSPGRTVSALPRMLTRLFEQGSLDDVGEVPCALPCYGCMPDYFNEREFGIREHRACSPRTGHDPAGWNRTAYETGHTKGTLQFEPP